MPLQSMAATLPPGFTETSISGLSTPTAFAIHQDGRIFVTQQGGALRVIKNGVLLPTPFTSVSTTSSGERGMLGIAIDPDYAANRYIYVYYTATTPATHNRVSRFTADPANEDVALAGSELVILDLDNLSGATNHNGGAIHFGLDGKLYVAVGDNASSANAQSLNNRLGKILRINSDGTIPGDNPTTFPGIAGSTTGLNQAIWAVGLRNPYTFGVQPGTGRMYINDVGQNTWEEIDDAGGGINFGWPTCEGGFLQGTNTPCTNPNFTNPVYTYSSSSGSECTIIGGSFYNPTNTTFPAPYVGKYFFADYCAGWIKYVDPANPSATGAAPTFASGIGFGAVDIHVSNDGSLHYLNRSSGTIFRVVYTGNPTPTNTPTSTATATLTPTFTPTATSTPTNTPTVVPSPFPEYDLTVSQTDSPDPVVVGQQLTYTLTVTNAPSALGGFACPNVRFGYPSGVSFSFNSASGTGGFNAIPDVGGITYSGGCLSSTGGQPQSATLTLVITPTSAGTLTSLGTSVVVDPENTWHEDNENNNTAATIITTVTTATPTNTPTSTLTATATATATFTPTPTLTPTATHSPTSPPQSTNTNTATPTATATNTFTPTVTPSPILSFYDLRISQSDSPDPVRVNQDLTYTLLVFNYPRPQPPFGDVACPKVRFGYPTGVPFAFVSTTGTNGYTSMADMDGVTFTGGCISSEGGVVGSATLTVVLRPLSLGALLSAGANVVVDPENLCLEYDETNNAAQTISTTVVTTPVSRMAFDYDGDRKSDISVFRPSTGAWYLQQSQAGLYGTLFGFGSDKIAPADYDGDGKTDIAVYRPSTGIWYVFNSSNGNVTYHVFGLAEDLPTPADYDGDGKADISVFRPSTGTWYRQNSSDGTFFGIQFGSSEDKPVFANFDGDGKSDIAVFRPSTGAWYWINSSNGSIQGELFGNGSDILTPADYDGDGKTDLSVYRPSTGIWYSKTSFNSLYTYFIFGLASDIPAPADYDGDGHADICVFRPSDGTWYRHNSSNTQFVAFQFGTNGDKPTQTAFRY
ncbi:MAG: PQQ-dependent sugar dehydrogenase [Chloracidobacterium sp.]|nr:PQQ-dependent sugar dehydrogenase [Chloracidobacterium sp.]